VARARRRLQRGVLVGVGMVPTRGSGLGVEVLPSRCGGLSGWRAPSVRRRPRRGGRLAAVFGSLINARVVTVTGSLGGEVGGGGGHGWQ